MRTASISIRTEPKTKKQAEAILKHLGLTTSEAINLFLRRVIIEKGLPFELRIPNEESMEAILDSEFNRNLTTFKNADEMFEDHGIANK
ncbi:MAG: type II toxin-antitoxin system RelB/DinJ family antitoxin [Candidatus Marinimicrobia bacterium]|nr:type II toxin-antitoxin system RelB/DinJ family antitoxin [Candidatus Neomarinimicrobiota bacterium]MBL7031532.1 type II toxin-antitoxin system RelB/DinJ family antitoxin [Candidatus Neomarinimicrobiota bacterium]